ncbi:MAG: hypothetical protein P8X58_12980 [Syntrophobacterales bacterium]
MMSNPEKESVSLLLTAGWVLTMNQKDEVFAPGAVEVRDANLVAVGPQEELTHRFAAERVLDYPMGLILPGLINAHTHAAMAHYFLRHVSVHRRGGPSRS